MEEVKALSEEPCTALKSWTGWLGHLGPGQQLQRKLSSVQLEQSKGNSLRRGRVLWSSSAVLHTAMSPAWWWSAQDLSCFVHAWSGTGTRIGDRASYVMQGGGELSPQETGILMPPRLVMAVERISVFCLDSTREDLSAGFAWCELTPSLLFLVKTVVRR